MKIFVAFLFIASVFFVGCNDNVIEEMTQQDEKALIGMEDALFQIISYNDSLVSYVEASGINNDATCFYFDRKYHTGDSLYNMYHNNYSHDKDRDDHQCCGMMGGNNSQGSMNNINVTQHMNNEHGQEGMGHHQEDHVFMESLYATHKQYHPGN